MSQLIAETFARRLLDKIMVEVLGIVEHHRQNGKFWEHDVDEETVNIQSRLVDGSPEQNHTHINYSKTEEIELITKIVRDLREIQIGDSRYVLPPSLLALEKQVKCAACNVEDLPLENPTDATETLTTQGQGDMHQIIATAILESLPKPTAEPAVTNVMSEEAISITVDLLHQMIDELDNERATTSKDTRLDSNSKECIAIWEEKEEQIIRTIESTADVSKIAEDIHQRNGSFDDSHDIEHKHNELSSNPDVASNDSLFEDILIEKRKSNSLSSAKLPRNNAVMNMEEILPIEDVKKRKISTSEILTKKKKGFGNRLRKFFRAVFSRRKN